MRKLYHPARSDISLAEVLYALSDPTRLSIVRMLAVTGEECNCSSFGLNVAKSTMSHHYKVLREAGVIKSRAEGTRYFLSLRREDLDALFPGLLDAIIQASLKEDGEGSAASSQIEKRAG